MVISHQFTAAKLRKNTEIQYHCLTFFENKIVKVSEQAEQNLLTLQSEKN